ncbi:MAG: TrbI/VirB10 family protein [Sphingomicrobium sp.]
MTELPPVNTPRVARKASRTKIAPFALGLGVIGTAVFASLASHRTARQEQASALPPLRTTTITAPAPPPAAMVANTATIVPIPIQAPPPPPVVAVPVQPQRPYGTVPVVRQPRSDNGAAERARARIAAPALIVDLPPARTGGDSPRATPMSFEDSGRFPAASMFHNASLQDPAGAAIVAAGPPPEIVAVAPVGSIDPGPRDLNSNERFSTRAGNKDTEVARAVRLPNQDMLVAQGTIIGAVMETALDSDLPGFARAIVTRDVLSFDGSQVLIPAGSHVIGEYNSGVAQGASRIFIVWNRLIRPDGVSVALGSPAVDDLGRGGLGGKVNRHFLQRFGGAILLSVLTGGIGAFTQSLSRGSTVIVSSTNEATSLAGQASKGSDIAPTIKTRQGATVRIFVARDLDFSAVGPTI